jgi:hypothetical protein
VGAIVVVISVVVVIVLVGGVVKAKKDLFLCSVRSGDTSAFAYALHPAVEQAATAPAYALVHAIQQAELPMRAAYLAD